MNLDAYRLALSGSGKLKMRATALLAEGGAERRVEAAMLFHEAARAERRAFAVLEAPPPEVRLAAAIEECWCLLEGFDPRAAAIVWGEVLRESERVTPDVAKAMRARLDRKFEAEMSAYRAALVRLYAVRARAGGAPLSERKLASLQREIDALLARFPGESALWWERSRLAELSGDMPKAWEALRTACRLNRDDARLAALSVLLAARALPQAEADAYLASELAGMERAAPEVCLLYAFAELVMAERWGRDKARWKRALASVNEGLSREGVTKALKRTMRAVRLLLEALLAGREPGVEVLYIAGLGDVVASAPPDREEDVVVMLEAAARREVAPREAA